MYPNQGYEIGSAEGEDRASLAGMETLRKLERVQGMLSFMQARGLSAGQSDSDRFLAEFLLFLVEDPSPSFPVSSPTWSTKFFGVSYFPVTPVDILKGWFWPSRLPGWRSNSSVISAFLSWRIIACIFCVFILVMTIWGESAVGDQGGQIYLWDTVET